MRDRVNTGKPDLSRLIPGLTPLYPRMKSVHPNHPSFQSWTDSPLCQEWECTPTRVARSSTEPRLMEPRLALQSLYPLKP